MTDVLITNWAFTKIYGVYDNAGTWTQSDTDNFPEKVALLDELSINNGTYSATLYDDTDVVEFKTAVTIDVPYIDGVPVVSSVAGYTKQSSHPKGQNNMAWGFVSIAELDRSDVDVFNADCRASVFYDSSNPTFWHLSELNLDTIVSYLEDDYKNTVFIADTLNKYDKPYAKTGDQYDYSATGEPLTKSQNLLIYGTEQTEPALKKIVKWIDTIGRKGL